MPATEQTCYSMPRLHRIFAVSSVCLVLATLWMLVRDHRREWKEYQRTQERIELRLARWRKVQALSGEVLAERDRLQDALAEECARPLSPSVLESLRVAIFADAERRGVEPSSWDRLQVAVEAVQAAAEQAESARRAWQAARLAADKANLQAEDAAVQAATAAGGDADAGELAERARATAAARDQALEAVQQTRRDTLAAQAVVAPLRASALQLVDTLVQQARFREDAARRQQRMEQAELDEAKSRWGLAVRDGRPEVEVRELADDVRSRQDRLLRLAREVEAATTHREQLQALRGQLTEREEAIRRRWAENEVEVLRCDQLLAEKESSYFRFWGVVPLPGKKWLEMPLLDAFNSPRQIENLWAEGLDRPAGSFGRVARFDRCTTCHQAIQRPLVADPESTGAPDHNMLLDFALVPSSDGPPEQADAEQLEPDRLARLFGLEFAEEGLVHPDDVTIRFVHPQGAARRALPWGEVGQEMRAGDIRQQMLQATSGLTSTRSPGLEVGDVLVAIDGQSVPADSTARVWAERQMLQAVSATETDFGRPLRLTVRRGLPQPYGEHPRLDLFLGEHSPHRLSDFACTVCHEGQGSATSFRWASHTPNDLRTRDRWSEQYGWFDNPHWDFPMYPRRFLESTCVKCHHDVVELERSALHPDPPAPKLAAGYRLIRTLGCFGCHEIRGYGVGDERIGPDLRLEPNYYAVALQFLGTPASGQEKLTTAERELLEALIADPGDESLRQSVRRLWREDAAKSVPEGIGEGDDLAALRADANAEPAGEAPRFSAHVHQTLLPLMESHDLPGTLRKVGPSLRFVGHKLDAVFLSDWIREPSHFRPTTRMPRSFGLWDHLPGPQLRARRDALTEQLGVLPKKDIVGGSREAVRIGADLAAVRAQLENVDEVEQRFEPLAIHSMVQYLLRHSQQYNSVELPPAALATSHQPRAAEQVERGRVAFEELGCLTCHDHIDFPEIRGYREADYVVEGPDLSDLSTKFAAGRNPHGAQWLYNWIRWPTRYSPRTTMPALTLDVADSADTSDDASPEMDVVADIVAYLLSGPPGGWQPQPASFEPLTAEDAVVLEELAQTYLEEVFPSSLAEQYVRRGIPDQQRQYVRGAERELLVSGSERDTLDDAQMTQKRLDYVAHKSLVAAGCFACHDIPGLEDARPIGPELKDWGRKDLAQLAFGHVDQYVGSREGGAAASQAPDNASDEGAAPADYYRQQLESRSRIGFLYQKLAEPRSFDYHEARTKRYTERLRMPQFSLSPTQREAVMTFVLGLVASPPQPKYVFTPDSRERAIYQGTELLTRYHCQGCHLLEAEQWQLAFPPDHYGARTPVTTYPFVDRQFSEAERRQSRQLDQRGLRHARLVGMPTLSEDGRPRIFDEEEFPIEEEEDESFELSRLIYTFDLWEPTLLDGHPYQVGDGSVDVMAEHRIQRRRSYGGALAKYLVPRVVRREQELNPAVKGADAWAWLPPALIGEGAKVQSAWLHEFLSRPYRIRPASTMLMPRYNMSSAEVAQLVDYFAALDHVEHPLEPESVRLPDYLAEVERQYARQLEQWAAANSVSDSGSTRGRHLHDAMQMVLNGDYCVKCHLIGDFDPGGSPRANGPNLAEVHRRLRADYLRQWLAKPTSLLPYTLMPVNIPYEPAQPLLGTNMPQELYRGDSLQQLSAMVDLLMNFDRYARQRLSVTPATGADEATTE